MSDFGDAASVASSSPVGGSGGGGRAQSHGKLINLAREIEETEKRTKNLEARNQWLCGKLIGLQKSFVKRVGVIDSGSRKKYFFKLWAESMHFFRLEHALEDSTSSLGECHQVARDLAAHLEDEQQARQRMVDSHKSSRIELQQLHASNQGLKEELEDVQKTVDLMEERLRIASGAAKKIRGKALSVPEIVGKFEKKSRDFRSNVDQVLAGKEEELADFKPMSPKKGEAVEDTASPTSLRRASTQPLPPMDRRGSTQAMPPPTDPGAADTGGAGAGGGEVYAHQRARKAVSPAPEVERHRA